MAIYLCPTFHSQRQFHFTFKSWNKNNILSAARPIPGNKMCYFCQIQLPFPLFTQSFTLWSQEQITRILTFNKVFAKVRMASDVNLCKEYHCHFFPPAVEKPSPKSNLGDDPLWYTGVEITNGKYSVAHLGWLNWTFHADWPGEALRRVTESN